MEDNSRKINARSRALEFGINMKMSVICPTYNRPERHENLYNAFIHQTHPDKELLVIDDSPEESPFFSQLNDPRVIYRHLSTRSTIGHKRNLMADLANGEIIVHFDDDDYYAPTYLEKTLQLIQGADLVKLSKWLAWQEVGGRLWEWDTGYIGDKLYNVSGTGESLFFDDLSEENRRRLAQRLDSMLWGYGFSYVYRKTLWEEVPFEDRNYGEDYAFVSGAQNLCKRCIHTDQYFNLVLHTLHPKSTSIIFPQFHLDSSQAVKILGEGVKPWLVVFPNDEHRDVF